MLMFLRNVQTYIRNSDNPNLYVTRSGEGHFVNARKGLTISAKHFDGNNLLYLPGLIDTHTHGIGGFDFSTVKSLADIHALMAAYANAGVPYVMATLVSLPKKELETQLRLLDAYIKQFDTKPKPGYARIVGIHLEGPWISHECKGAHAEHALDNEISLDKFIKVISVAPHVTNWKLTLAPDIKGALTFIQEVKRLTHLNVSIFIGHTNSNDELLDSVHRDIPIRITHLGNANCEPKTRATDVTLGNLTSHVVKWALSHSNTTVELIVDGQHLSTEFVNLVLKQLGTKRVILVSDSLSPAGQPDGEYQLGSLTITKHGNKITLAGSEKLAGSAATLPQILKQYISILKQLKLTTEQLIEAIYFSAVNNPRETAIPQKMKLDDLTNFSVIDLNTGDLVLSVCNSNIKKFRDIKAISHNLTQPTLLQKPANINSNSTDQPNMGDRLKNTQPEPGSPHFIVKP